MKTLIAYYSRKGENYFSGMIMELEKGNTEIIAEMIAEKTKGTLFEIRQKNEYSNDYNQCTMEAKNDKIKGIRPDLVAFPEDIDSYDVIFLGYPNYWGTCPMAVFSFLEKANFKGKKIIPFCTHEGSGFGNSISDLRKATEGNEILEGLSYYGSKVTKAHDGVNKWLSKIGY